jgi:hypothetical protein
MSVFQHGVPAEAGAAVAAESASPVATASTNDAARTANVRRVCGRGDPVMRRRRTNCFVRGSLSLRGVFLIIVL